ncbi:exopolyphosphatase [Psychrosphaera saromensis]|uniref:Exopolyphosphatase n=1 Tax=Psychrosphaera saromensis TaxID=716813 RepID=A0A2S7UZB3_9GAMM|nr:exopolyphosphatase [Psychrosphaera saromensis]PQJ55119.1 exopolyphosphatase [Psychrosphaera saromensis]
MITKTLDSIESANSTKIAVLDIGSNSFHLVVARVISNTVQILHKTKIKVHLADGLSKDHHLSQDAINRGLEALEIIQHSLDGFEPETVRIVATYTLRKAKNALAFIKAAKKILPYPIEIISGQEEARLIYNGVAHTETLEGKTLVVDIGGGSTEFSLGQQFEPILLRSIDIGCVSFQQMFFNQGKVKRKMVNKAIVYAQQQLALIENKYIKQGWQQCIGTSGTIESIVAIVNKNAIGNKDSNANKGSNDGTLSLIQLETLMEKLIATEDMELLELGDVNEDRRQLIPAGLAILIAIFKQFEIDKMSFAQAALREGVIYEMEDSLTHTNVQERSVQSLASRYDIDTIQANLVLNTAFKLFKHVKKDWQLKSSGLKQLLGWSALLHEIGLHVSSTGVHKHSHYILSNSDLPGFNAEEQQFLAMLTRFHRKRIRLEEVPIFSQFSAKDVLHCIILLRLSVLLNIKRQQDFLPEFTTSVSDNEISLQFPENWLSVRPIIEINLAAEQEKLARIGIELNFL